MPKQSVLKKPPHESRRRHVGRRFKNAGPGTYVLLVFVVLLSVFPLYWSFVAASRSQYEIANYPPSVLPGGMLWSHLKTLFVPANGFDSHLKAGLINSTIVSSIITFCTVFFCSLAGFAFAKLPFRGNKVLMVTVIATLAVPPQIGLIPLYIEMIHFHWLYSLKAVTIPFLVSAFGVFLMRQYIATGVPNELIDAARVDGCHTARVFWHVVLPAVRPIAAVLGLLTFMNAWNDYLWPVTVLQPTKNPTVQVAVASVAGTAYIPDISLQLAAVFVSIIPLFVIFILLGRQIVGGIMQGAVKG